MKTQCLNTITIDRKTLSEVSGKVNIIFSKFNNKSSEEIIDTVKQKLDNSTESRIVVLNFNPKNTKYSSIDLTIVGQIAMGICIWSICYEGFQLVSNYFS